NHITGAFLCQFFLSRTKIHKNTVIPTIKQLFISLSYFYIVSRQEETRFQLVLKPQNKTLKLIEISLMFFFIIPYFYLLIILIYININTIISTHKQIFISYRYFYIISRQEETRFQLFLKPPTKTLILIVMSLKFFLIIPSFSTSLKFHVKGVISRNLFNSSLFNLTLYLMSIISILLKLASNKYITSELS